MAGFRVALAQMNPLMGDLRGNAEAVREWVGEAATREVDLVVFPEMALTGYPVDDLALRPSFVMASHKTLEWLATQLAKSGLGDLPVVVGCLTLDATTGTPADAVAVLHGGRVLARSFKNYLPDNDVFSQTRVFSSGDSMSVLQVGGTEVALMVGEDLRYSAVPCSAAAPAGIGLVVGLAGEPYCVGEGTSRLEFLAQRAQEVCTPIAWVNLVGGQDDLVFDGGSVVMGADGRVVAQASRFVEQLLVADLCSAALPRLDRASMRRQAPTVRHVSLNGFKGRAPRRHAADSTQPLPIPGPRGTGSGIEEEVWQALVTGTRDYAHKNRFTSAVVALSGGIDSAVVSVIAADALGASHVVAVSMPSACSTGHSQNDAAELGRRVGLDFRSIPIQPLVDPVLHTLSLDGIAVENVQARMRSVIAMALSNQEGHLMLNTGNKTEYGCGHATLYGDSAGGYAPLKDVPKTLVWRLARWRNAQAEERGELPPIPEHIILKEPSPELSAGQVDSQLLPAPYEVLDHILAGYIDANLGRDELVASGSDAVVVDRVIQMVERGEFKRRQAPPGPKISRRSFGRDRRFPVTNRYIDRGVDQVTGSG
ncbi:NAD+ synthase [Streptomyces sp. NPDC002659]|uniref:NAD+ synthase n=1 Tax=Streptomyces sp. NPDC002659 TaxID=3364656 RepID=UPI0036A7F293